MTYAIKHGAATLGAGPRGWLSSAMAAKSVAFDREWWVNRVREETGKSLSEQTLEIRKLSAGPGRIQSEEYYEYGLYDDRRFDDADREAFVGKAAWAIMARKFNESSARDPGYDRVKAIAYLSRKGAPLPMVYAMYQNEPSASRQTETISDADPGFFLRNEVRYPFVGTPVKLGTHGTPVTVYGYDKLLDCLILEEERRVPVISFINAVRRHGDTGYIFEEAHLPYPLLTPLTGRHVTTVRMMVFRDGDTHRIVRPVWIVPYSNNTQTMIGRAGNLVAGAQFRAGVGCVPARHTERHLLDPSGHGDAWGRRSPTGTRSPTWSAVATSFPRLGVQRWDVALTERGPVVVWVSGQADIHTAQKVWRKAC